MSIIHLNLDDLGLRGGQRHICVHALDIAPIVFGGVSYEVIVPDGMTVTVHRVAGGYLVQVEMNAKVFGPCWRCLKDAGVDVHAAEEEFVPTAAGGWAESESSPFVNDMVVDLPGLSREALVLALPARVLCTSECKGLCPQCGADLNEGECECRPLEI